MSSANEYVGHEVELFTESLNSLRGSKDQILQAILALEPKAKIENLARLTKTNNNAMAMPELTPQTSPPKNSEVLTQPLESRHKGNPIYGNAEQSINLYQRNRSTKKRYSPISLPNLSTTFSSRCSSHKSPVIGPVTGPYVLAELNKHYERSQVVTPPVGARSPSKPSRQDMKKKLN
eukprot:Platyproteum_vivax@DN3270_c0_g1_i1.p1